MKLFAPKKTYFCLLRNTSVCVEHFPQLFAQYRALSKNYAWKRVFVDYVLSVILRNKYLEMQVFSESWMGLCGETWLVDMRDLTH